MSHSYNVCRRNVRLLDGRYPNPAIPAPLNPNTLASSEKQLIRHVGSNCGMISKDSMLSHWLPRLHRTEKVPQIWLHIVSTVAVIYRTVIERVISKLGIVLGVPLLSYSSRIFAGKLFA